jgi:hypothetical protein
MEILRSDLTTTDRSLAPDHATTMAEISGLTGASLSNAYDNTNYPASHGISNTGTTAVVANGLGHWWKATIPSRHKIYKVSILNTNQFPAARLADT